MSDDCRTDVAQNILDFLRRLYPANTAINVAADTGIPAETIQKMIDRASMPSGFNLLRLAGHYGAEFLVAAYPNAPRWLDRAHRMEERERLLALKADIDAKLEAM